MARSVKQERLFRFMKDRARDGRSFMLDEVLEATGYMPSALRTNLSKHLKGVWVSAVDERHFRVHDFDGVSLPAFLDALSQNTRLSFEDEQQWRRQLRKLLALGVQHGHPVGAAVRSLLAELGVAGK